MAKQPPRMVTPTRSPRPYGITLTVAYADMRYPCCYGRMSLFPLPLVPEDLSGYAQRRCTECETQWDVEWTAQPGRVHLRGVPADAYTLTWRTLRLTAKAKRHP